MAVPVSGLPLLLRVGMRVAAVPPALRANRWHEVVSCFGSGTGQLVRLSGVTGISGAEGLVGKVLLAPVGELPPDFALHDAPSLVGRAVEDVRLGWTGTIVAVMCGPANDVWVVEGPRGEVLLPVVPSVVGPVLGEGAIPVRVPEGSLGEAQG